MGDLLFGEYYDEQFQVIPSYYEEHEFPFIKGECEGWDLCGNCHNYLMCGRCALDNHEVDYDDTCTYNLKKEDRND